MSYRLASQHERKAVQGGCAVMVAAMFVNLLLWAVMIVGGIWLAVRTLEWVGVL